MPKLRAIVITVLVEDENVSDWMDDFTAWQTSDAPSVPSWRRSMILGDAGAPSKSERAYFAPEAEEDTEPVELSDTPDGEFLTCDYCGGDLGDGTIQIHDEVFCTDRCATSAADEMWGEDLAAMEK
jgi:hypothetical protein